MFLRCLMNIFMYSLQDYRKIVQHVTDYSSAPHFHMRKQLKTRDGQEDFNLLKLISLCLIAVAVLVKMHSLFVTFDSYPVRNFMSLDFCRTPSPF